MSRPDRSEEFGAEFLVKLVEQGFNSILCGVGGRCRRHFHTFVFLSPPVNKKFQSQLKTEESFAWGDSGHLAPHRPCRSPQWLNLLRRIVMSIAAFMHLRVSQRRTFALSNPNP